MVHFIFLFTPCLGGAPPTLPAFWGSRRWSPTLLRLVALQGPRARPRPLRVWGTPRHPAPAGPSRLPAVVVLAVSAGGQAAPLRRASRSFMLGSAPRDPAGAGSSQRGRREGSGESRAGSADPCGRAGSRRAAGPPLCPAPGEPGRQGLWPGWGVGGRTCCSEGRAGPSCGVSARCMSGAEGAGPGLRVPQPHAAA